MKPGDEPMLDRVGGDVGMSRHLAKTLKIIADSPGIDADLEKQIRRILSGQGTVRDLARSEAFTRMSEAVMPAVAARLASTVPEELQRLARAGDAIIARYRNEIPDVPAAEPPLREAPSPNGPSRSATTHPVDHRPPGPSQSVVPGTRRPDRDRIVTPEEPDEDDLYYQDRRRRGWLQ
ncbi:hypothetical protein [Nocardia farcinica]|uniref:hypothetical protein n=1 Tax=Nocardia farcinica TaxID=37329 RepID=UPI0022BA0FA5|nr:hypothetical protein [Nocardia farcinica]MCZ9328916.1 hypothetical protein [Nocardia farcinica]